MPQHGIDDRPVGCDAATFDPTLANGRRPRLGVIVPATVEKLGWVAGVRRCQSTSKLRVHGAEQVTGRNAMIKGV